ncbi:MAG: hypothetical protein JO022_13335, partial [Acidobacteriaceae bacterium]|nr:hypothetical protein [Acidobacteriaceae bacterium]
MLRVAVLLVTAQALSGAVDFQKQVAPILEQDCVPCHSASKAAGGLAIVSRQALMARKSVVPGSAATSKVYVLAASGAMPPGAKLPDAKLALLKQWIDEGASWP